MVHEKSTDTSKMVAAHLNLAAWSRPIARFLRDDEQLELRRTSRLLSCAFRRLTVGVDRLLVLADHREELRKQLRSMLSPLHSTKSKRQRVKISDSQLDALMRDLLLVGLGVRPSCLVDCCTLDDDTVKRVLAESATSTVWTSFGSQNLRAIRMAGNIFFVHTTEFLRLKCLDCVERLASVTFVDASADLKKPCLLPPVSSYRSDTRREAVDVLLRLVTRLVTSERRLIETKRLNANATTIAGLILCYPAVYVVRSSISEEEDPMWTIVANCLGMCPLHLIQVSIRINEVSFTLQEFSIPQSLGAKVAGLVTSRSRRTLDAMLEMPTVLNLPVSAGVHMTAVTRPTVGL